MNSLPLSFYETAYFTTTRRAPEDPSTILRCWVLLLWNSRLGAVAGHWMRLLQGAAPICPPSLFRLTCVADQKGAGHVSSDRFVDRVTA